MEKCADAEGGEIVKKQKYSQKHGKQELENHASFGMYKAGPA